MNKTNFLLFTIIIMGMFICTSCNGNSTGPGENLSNENTMITFLSPPTQKNYVLNRFNSNKTLLTLKWNNPDLILHTSPNYFLKMYPSQSGENQIVQLANTNQNSYSIKVGKMNSILLGMGLPANQSVTMNLIVTAIRNADSLKVTSKPLILSFTPYGVMSDCKYCPEIYIPGSYQSASGYGGNWSPGDAPALYTINGGDKYEGYVYFANSSSLFKITSERNWSNFWGAGSSENTLDPTGPNIPVPGKGYFKIDVDLDALTYTTTKTKWAIYAKTANGWDNIPMMYKIDKKVWIKTLDLKQGPFIFRANNSSVITYGDTGGDGILDEGGANIMVPATGNYTVTLDLNDFPHTYSLKMN